MKTPRLIVAFGFALVLNLCAIPALLAEVALPRGVVAGPSIEGISEYRLPNGLRVLLFPDASKPTVTVNLVYGVGSVHENYGQTGMAHLLEHLLFKGTPTHADISGEMKKRGIDFNATTSMDRTNYFSSFPANAQTLDWVLALEADRMINSNIAKRDLDSEMTVVRNELEAGENNPGGVLLQRIRSTAFLWHNYGHSTIGARSDVEGVPIEQLQGFYRTWYQPDNATLILAGRLDPATVLARVNAHFGKIRKPARELPQFHTVEPAQDGPREVDVRRSGDVRFIAAVYHVPAAGHPDSAALSVLGNVLGYSPGGRLHKALVQTHLAAGTGAGSEALRDPGLFSVLAVVPKDGDAGKAEGILLEQAEALSRQPITAQEVDEAKQRINNAYELYFTDVNAVGMGLSEFLAAGDWRLLFITRDAIEKVSADDVNRVAATYLKSSNRTLGRFIPTDPPDRVAIAQRPAVASLVEGYTGREAVAAGEQFDPTPQNLEARTQRFTLGSGLRVALLPKKTRGGTVMVSANFRFGDVATLTGREDAAGLAGAMLMRGSQSLTREQIDQRFEALKTEADIDGNLQGASISLLSRSGTLAEALALAADVLRHPAFPETEFEQLRLQALTGMEASRKEPGSVAGQALAEHFDPWPVGHPLHIESLDDAIAGVRALKRSDLVAFHRDFYGTAEGEIAVVGDFDPVAVKQQLQQLFAEWQSPHPYQPIATQYVDVAAAHEQLRTPDKPNAVLLARSNLSLRVTDPDYPALLIANRIFGGGALKSRLGDRIRQKDGLSYGVASSVRADDSREGTDDNGSFNVQAIAAPENMAKVEAAIREELARFIRDGISEEELRDAVAGTLTEREQNRAEDGSVAGMLADQAYYGRTMQFTADLDAKYAGLTREQVNAAIRKHLRADTLSVYLAGDFKP
ncbi:M16 family metallopeptidase [Pseudoxanthomonas indica]|uniref:Zinc protease n=1 Tax=Pseudoxanthomonas indica TaxID=428993 RepID=A0A1T5KVD8_9GAMM|nr:pitrilysin family protein [Pseudoxanthomonas indica]GGD51597.1 peptidase M16 [Pseudoxanthomonas indica]SKC67188.1 zinc protease [Pseudoxanthomonas indica]